MSELAALIWWMKRLGAVSLIALILSIGTERYWDVRHSWLTPFEFWLVIVGGAWILLCARGIYF